MRIGLKIIGVRGGNMSKKFVDLLQKNNNVDIFEELDIPGELDNYNKMIDLLR